MQQLIKIQIKTIYLFSTKKIHLTRQQNHQIMDQYQHHQLPSFPHKLQSLEKSYIQRLRKNTIDNMALPKFYPKINALRQRRIQDTIPYLLNRSQCAGVILARDQQTEDVDFVADMKAIHRLRRKPLYMVDSYTVSAGKTQTRCLINKIQFEESSNRAIKIYLKRYIVGRPNYITIPLVFNRFYSNKHLLHPQSSYSQRKNAQYPMSIHVDMQYIHPKRPFCVGDIKNMLPRGIYIDKTDRPQYEKELVLEIKANPFIKTQKQIQDQLKLFDSSLKQRKQLDKKKQDQEQEIEEIQEIEEFSEQEEQDQQEEEEEQNKPRRKRK